MGGTYESQPVTAEQLLHRRRLRAAVFEGYGDGFGEPAWDMLLLLTSAEERSIGLVPVADVIEEARSPHSNAVAYLTWLKTQDLVKVEGEAAGLTDRGRNLMTSYLSAVRGESH